MRSNVATSVAWRSGVVIGLALNLLAGFVASANAATETVVYSFGGSPDGAYPEAGLIDVKGTLYGTTLHGGTGGCGNTQYSGCGTVFSISPGGAETVVHSFLGYPGDGSSPAASLINVDGTLYGTTQTGGATGFANQGTIFSFKPKTGAEVTIYSFCEKGVWCADGARPLSNLINVQGTLYGTTYNGGANAGGDQSPGTVFSFIPKTGAEAVVHSFVGYPDDGALPVASLINVAGNLYGTTTAGGSCPLGSGIACGTVFSVTPAGNENVVYSFQGSPDGYYPAASLINVDGTLWGTTLIGGASNQGTVFKVTPAGAETVVYSFSGCGDNGGAWPSNLIKVKGKLYGTTPACGANQFGTVFSIDPNTGTEKVIYSFQGGNDGANPTAGLIDVGGTLYGTTVYGGNGGCYGGCGTVFSVTP